MFLFVGQQEPFCCLGLTAGSGDDTFLVRMPCSDPSMENQIVLYVVCILFLVCYLLLWRSLLNSHARRRACGLLCSKSGENKYYEAYPCEGCIKVYAHVAYVLYSDGFQRFAAMGLFFAHSRMFVGVRAMLYDQTQRSSTFGEFGGLCW